MRSKKRNNKRTILIISGKGGVGKTTTAINLASALHAIGKNVLLIDSAVTTPDIGLHLGAPVVPVNFHDVLAGKAKPEEAIYLHSSGLKVLPGSIALKDMTKARPEMIKRAVTPLKKYADFLIMDCAAGFSKETLHALEAASEIIVVTNPDLPSVTNALKAIKMAERFRKKILGVIVTRKKGSKNEMSLNNISDMLEANILGVVPEDEKVKEAIDNKEILLHTYPRSRAAKAYKEIASKLIGEELSEKEGGGLFTKLLRMFGFRT